MKLIFFFIYIYLYFCIDLKVINKKFLVIILII